MRPSPRGADSAADALADLRISSSPSTSSSVPTSIPSDLICKFYARGYCARGAACRFLHPPREGDSSDSFASTVAAPAPPLTAPDVRQFVSPSPRRLPAAADTPVSSAAPSGEYVDFADAYAAVFRPDDGASQGNGGVAGTWGSADGFVSSLADERARSYVGVATSSGRGAGNPVGVGTGSGAASGMTPHGLTAPSVRPTGTWAGGGDVSRVTPAQSMLCRYHADGNCRYGDGCQYVHGTFCSVCRKNILHPTDNTLAAKHVRECTANADRLEKINASQSVDCGICYENPAALGRKFGLLQNCEHAFCLECVRCWRGPDNAESFGKENVRSCPVCRVGSYVIIPSDSFETDPEQKQLLLERYRAKLKRIPCKHYSFGEGTCPFGSRCMYSHTDREGREEEDPNIVFNDIGASQVKSTLTLTDYL